MTRKERAEVRDAMKSYKAEGHTMAEVAEKFGYTKAYVQMICKGIAPQQSICKNYRNQYTGGNFDREANAIRYIEERTPDFEYVGNYTGIDGYVDLRCKKCNTVMRKSFVTVKHGTTTCYVCQQRETQKRADIRRQQIRAESKKKAEEKARKKALDLKYGTKFKQISLSQCPVCGKGFIATSSKNIYCSKECRNQNKWILKDGYRYLFPLNEVYERDNGICYLCGKPCDWNDYTEENGVIVYGNNYPSRDHVIPKSKGGRNTWNNIRLAHRWCNSCKADASPCV